MLAITSGSLLAVSDVFEASWMAYFALLALDFLLPPLDIENMIKN